MNPQEKKIGILGGGQLGRMIIQSVSNYDLFIAILDPNPNCPSASLCNSFYQGDFNNYDDVLAFGRTVDVLTIEIEHVNTKALFDLEKEGVEVFPQPKVIELIKDKGAQKEFYKKNDIPTSAFKLINNKEQLLNQSMPYVAKTRTGGYDGKGVCIVNSKDDLNSPFFEDEVYIEEQINFEKELSVIVSRNKKGEVVTYPLVEQEFNLQANLVEFLFSPADVSKNIIAKANQIAKNIIEKLEMVGLLAVELFLLKNGSILVNEIAPRPHNSGHHTIEACVTSQFEQHIRSILNWKLGSTSQSKAGVMVNLLGEDGYQGDVFYEGIQEAMDTPFVYPHIYGKQQTKPFRKMGHVTVINDSLEEAQRIARDIKETIKVKTK